MQQGPRLSGLQRLPNPGTWGTKQEEQRLPPGDLNGQAAGKGRRAARGGSEAPGTLLPARPRLLLWKRGDVRVGGA